MQEMESPPPRTGEGGDGGCPRPAHQSTRAVDIQRRGRVVARAEQRGYDLTLLMGLDLPWVADGLFRDGPAVRDATDAVLRRELQIAGVRYQTIYGKGPQRLQQALRAIGKHLGRQLLADDPALRLGRGRWVCDSCSDPDCEHRLFSQLLTTDHTRDPPP